MAGHILGKGICGPVLAGQQPAQTCDDMNPMQEPNISQGT